MASGEAPSSPLWLVTQTVCLLLGVGGLGAAPEAAVSSAAGPRAAPGPDRLRLMTPLHLRRTPLQRIDQDTDLPGSGRFELSAGVTVSFSSPNYPDKYTSPVWKSWMFWVAGESFLELSCPDYQLGEQDLVIVRRGRERRIKFTSRASPELRSREPLLVQLRTKNVGRMMCTVRALLDDGAAQQQNTETVVNRQPFNTQNRPLFSHNNQMSTASKPLFAEQRPAAVGNRPLLPGAGPVAGQTKPLFPAAGLASTQNRPLFPEATPVVELTKPLFSQTGVAPTQNRPLFPEVTPVVGETKPLFSQTSAQNRPLLPEAAPVAGQTKPLFPETGAISVENRPLFPASSPVNELTKPLFAEQRPVAAENRPPFLAEKPVAIETKPLFGSLATVALQNKPLFPATGSVEGANPFREQEQEAEEVPTSVSGARLIGSGQIKTLDRYDVELEKASLNSPICGKAVDTARIVGGSYAQEKEFPWLAAVVSSIGSTPFCGAAIIGDRFLVTAAHCVYRKESRRVSVMVKKRKRFLDSRELRVRLDRIIVHPEYNDTTQFNDIAILKTRRSMADLFAEPDGRVRPICLPTSRCSGGSPASAACFASRRATVAGWGVGNPTLLTSPAALQQVQLPILDNDACRSTYKELYEITDDMICAGYQKGGKDACQGDSGGPLTVKGDGGVFTMVGVVSFGKGCAEPDHPGVYTRVSEYLDWIIETARK